MEGEFPLTEYQAQRLIKLLEKIEMSIAALNTSIGKLSAAITAYTAAVTAAEANTVPQADVDAAQVAVDTITAQVVAATPVTPVQPVVTTAPASAPAAA